jgi:NAD(P)-dependent dehydrogenase (short-subunit alcohol dehydrogenase family)
MFNRHRFLDFSSKTILITGAASGLGRVTAVTLSSLGAKLLLLDVNKDGLNKTEALCHNDCSILVHDLEDIGGLRYAVENKITEIGKLDCLVNIAGISCVQPLKTLKIETAEYVFKINTLAPLELSKIFCCNQNHRGENPSITFVSSVYGIVGSSANVAYAMSKSALHGVTRSLAIEMARKRIRVNSVAPGFIKTGMLDNVSDIFDDEYKGRINELHPLGLGEPHDIANAVVFLASDMSKWITGTILSVDGGFTAR